MEIADLTIDDPRLPAAAGVLAELRGHLSPDEIVALLPQMFEAGYRIAAAFEDSSCLGVAGFRVHRRLASGRVVYVDDLITGEAHRSSGVGKALLDHVASIASAEGCLAVTLDSATWRTDAHRFYEREGFDVRGFNFIRPL
jgi:GNAT superfamily N-acetyltransferase